MGAYGMRLAALFLACLPLHSAAFVNSIRCQNVQTCVTTWPVTSGNLLVVGTSWAMIGAGTISDSQGNSYTLIGSGDTYLGHRRLRGTVLSSGGGVVTVKSSTVESNIVIAEFSGVTLQVLTSAAYGAPGTFASCPPSAPLSVTTTTSVLLLSMWVMDSGAAVTCAASSGVLLPGASCGGFTQQMDYQFVPAGTYSQQFAVVPSFSGGDTNCGVYALPASAPAPQLLSLEQNIPSGLLRATILMPDQSTLFVVGVPYPTPAFPIIWVPLK